MTNGGVGSKLYMYNHIIIHLHLYLRGKAHPLREAYVPDQQSVTLITATSLLKVSREGAAATAASKLFRCLIVLGKKLCWMKVLEE